MTTITPATHGMIRWSYAARRVLVPSIVHLLPRPICPQSGDIVLARLEKIGRNKRLELANGRLCSLHVGDTLAVVFGNRYATAQYEGYARSNGDACDLMSMAGVCGLVTSKHDDMFEPSKLRLLGALADGEKCPLNLKHFALAPASGIKPLRVVVVCGSAMDSGKTHTAMSLVVGLRRQDHKVAYIKLTGTASGRDTWSVQDAGATPCLEFIDGGYPSTYLASVRELRDLYSLLVGNATAQGAEWIIVEIADGLLQAETAGLLRDPEFSSSVDCWLLSAGEPLAAIGALQTFRGFGLEPVALSGRFTMSPLGMLETKAATGLRCVTAGEIQAGDLNQDLLQSKR